MAHGATVRRRRAARAAPAMTPPLGADELAALGLASLGDPVFIDGDARLFGAGSVSVGSHVRIDAFAVVSAGEGGIAIGDHVHVAAHVFMAGSGRIELEDFAGLSGRVSIYSSNDDYSGDHMIGPAVPDRFRGVTAAPVTVSRHAIIGAGAVILPGVTIGEGAAVGALSLVRRDVEPFAVVAGVPARPVGTRSRGMLELERELRRQES